MLLICSAGNMPGKQRTALTRSPERPVNTVDQAAIIMQDSVHVCENVGATSLPDIA